MPKYFQALVIVSLFLNMTSALSAEANVKFRGETYAMQVDGCRSGEGWHMIDASGKGVSLSIVGNTGQDGSTYETLDFMVSDVRASGVNKDKPFLFKDKTYKYSGEVHQSDKASTPGEIEVEVTCD